MARVSRVAAKNPAPKSRFPAPTIGEGKKQGKINQRNRKKNNQEREGKGKSDLDRRSCLQGRNLFSKRLGLHPELSLLLPTAFVADTQ